MKKIFISFLLIISLFLTLRSDTFASITGTWSVSEPLRCFNNTAREYKKMPSGLIQQRIYVYDNITNELHHKEFALYKPTDKYVWPGEEWYTSPIDFGDEYGFAGHTWWVYWVTDTENGDLYFPSQVYKWCL